MVDPEPAPEAPAVDPNVRWRYGLIVVVVAIVAIVLIFLIGAIRYRTAADAGALVPALATSISTLAAAYFGVQIGSSGKEQAEKRKDEAEKKKDEAKDETLALAADAPPNSEVAQRIVRRHALQNPGA